MVDNDVQKDCIDLYFCGLVKMRLYHFLYHYRTLYSVSSTALHSSINMYSYLTILNSTCDTYITLNVRVWPLL